MPRNWVGTLHWVEIGMIIQELGLTWNNSWDDATIAERYSGEVGEEWKERLSAKVEGRDYVPSTKPAASSMSFQSSATPSNSGSRSQTPLSTRTDSPSRGGPGKAKVDDKYFAGLGAANASRPADLPPSQGGKYAGFGSSPLENTKQDPKMPGFDDLQRDPVAALTRGFGWFTTTVGKTAKTVNDGYIQPTAAKVCFALLPSSSFRFPPESHAENRFNANTMANSWRTRIWQGKPSSPPRKSHEAPKQAQRAPRRASTGSSRAAMGLHLEEHIERRRLTRVRRISGTALRTRAPVGRVLSGRVRSRRRAVVGPGWEPHRGRRMKIIGISGSGV